MLGRSEYFGGFTVSQCFVQDPARWLIFIAFFASAPLVSYPLIIPQEQVAMILEVHVMHVTRHVEEASHRGKAFPLRS